MPTATPVPSFIVTGYPIPATSHETELVVKNSRFISCAAFTDTVEAAREFLQIRRDIHPTANHSVYAFRVGYGQSVIEGMSDAGEPSGTAGPPTLAVLRGVNIGDIILVTTRYFGGTKLGTGGLVRAYTESAQLVLANLPTELKIKYVTMLLEVPYPLYDRMHRVLLEYEAQILSEDFSAFILIAFRIVAGQRDIITKEIVDVSLGSCEPIEV